MDADRLRRARATLVLIAAIFLGTPLAAWIVYSYTDVGHGGRTVNRGRLVEPPVPLDVARLPAAQPDAQPVELRDAWFVLHLAGDGCDEACAAELLTTRQVRLSLGRDAVRVRRLVVSRAPDADRAALAAAHPDLAWLDGRDAAIAAFAARVEGAPAAPAAPVGLYVIDPLGNLMMTYAPHTPPKDVQADLKRLLKLSESWMRKP